MHATPVRRRVAGATMALGAVLVGISLLAPSASAGGGTLPFFDPADYDTTLHEPHRGTSADASGFEGECPDDESVAGLTAWHLVLGQGDNFTSGTLDVRVTIDGVGVTLSDLTAADDFDGFDPATNYLQHNDGQQAYVYAGDGDDVLVDAAADVADGAADKIVLSHICPGEGETDDGGTDDVAATDSVQSSTDDTEVLGNVVEPQQLPATGDDDASLAVIGAALILIGGGILVIRRNLATSS